MSLQDCGADGETSTDGKLGPEEEPGPITVRTETDPDPAIAEDPEPASGEDSRPERAESIGREAKKERLVPKIGDPEAAGSTT